ncbi:MAG: hypothetical protein SGILL_005176, partial [Bacillariaceae sp.]
FADELESVTIGTGACSGNRVCKELVYVFDRSVTNSTVKELIVNDNVCSGSDGICEECLYRMDSIDLLGSTEVLSITNPNQCPLGPFTYSR